MDRKSINNIRLCTTGTALAVPTGDPTTDGWVGYTLSASGTLTSDAIDLNKYEPDGFCSIQFAFTGTGTAQLTYTMSNNNSTFAAPNRGGTIASGLTTGSHLYEIKLEPFRYLKIVLTETGGANTVVITEAMLSII